MRRTATVQLERSGDTLGPGLGRVGAQIQFRVAGKERRRGNETSRTQTARNSHDFFTLDFILIFYLARAILAFELARASFRYLH